jgi:predicted metal-dependent enzyme (double-stranded beta helix superfamily)
MLLLPARRRAGQRNTFHGETRKEEAMHAQQVTQVDEWLLDNPRLRQFIQAANDIRGRLGDPHEIVGEIRPHFAALLTDPTWLPAHYQEPREHTNMGQQTGMWLLYRAGDGGLAFSALVLSPGAQTPVHDHLAWGLVGLYRGTQDEEVYSRRDDASRDGYAQLELAERNQLRPGDFYELMPSNDIHRVRTTSDVTSVSLHLLGNDNGCIWRHRFEPEVEQVAPFRSGWLNVECREPSA